MLTVFIQVACFKHLEAFLERFTAGVVGVDDAQGSRGLSSVLEGVIDARLLLRDLLIIVGLLGVLLGKAGRLADDRQLLAVDGHVMLAVDDGRPALTS